MQPGNATAVTNFPTATADWGTMSYQALLDGPLFAKTWTQSTTTVTISHVAHGLGLTNASLGSLSGTYVNATDQTCVVTLPIGHGFNTGDLLYLTFDATSGHPTTGRFTVTAASATTVSIASSGSSSAATGTVTAAWLQYVDVFFGSSSAGFPTSQRYPIASVSTDSFTIVVVASQTVTTSNLQYSAANLLGYAALAQPIVINSGDTTSVPANGTTATFD